MPDSAHPPELRRPGLHSPADPHGFGAQLVDDVAEIVSRVRYIEVSPAYLWESGLLSELADASDRLAAKVAKLQGAQGADR